MGDQSIRRMGQESHLSQPVTEVMTAIGTFT